MKDYKIERVVTKEQLDVLYKSSALTIEGLCEETIGEFVQWLEEHTTFTTDTLIVYVISGAIMNYHYGLTGTNAYPDDCNVVSVKDIDLMSVVYERFSIGGRWFDDIVDNNARRQAAGYC